ncbi:MAG: PadR family transcriptional regulator [Proteobacteria bacterium]|nr:MAG: PadR family transcriptional regulator [Pseudomonadota bacterium]
MSSSYALLGLLGREPSHGYDLKREYDRFFGSEKPLAFGQVYATLTRLTRDNLVESQGSETGGGPDRKRFAITALGEQEIFQWIRKPESAEPFLQTTLYVKTVLALILDKQPEIYLDDQRAAHLSQMRELTKMKHQSDMAKALLIDHALFHIEADLRWIDLTAARLDALAKELKILRN